ncbi:MAG: hypothetical protein ABEK16_00920 [Candidatus Nanohalobium sp.]
MLGEKRQVILLFAVAVIASGCGTTTTQNQNTGSSVISVNTFEAIPNPVPAGQTMTLNMELENTGDAPARQVAARVFGPAWLNSQYSKAERTETFGTLRAKSESSPSVPKTATWSFSNTPGLKENREATYTIFSKIFYSYETTATAEFKLVSGSRYREQGYTQTDASVENSQAPIQLDIRGTTPKIYYDSDGGDVTSEICVVVNNEGEGTAFTGGEQSGRAYEMGNAKKDTVKLTISARGDIQFQRADKNGNFRNPLTVQNLKLINGQEGYQCFTMRASSLTNSETNVNVNLEAQYNYKKETQTQVTVEGRRGASNTDTETTDSSDSGDSSGGNSGAADSAPGVN